MFIAVAINVAFFLFIVVVQIQDYPEWFAGIKRVSLNSLLTTRPSYHLTSVFA